MNCLKRHLLGDFGEIPEQDFKENLYSLEHDLRIISSYSYIYRSRSIKNNSTISRGILIKDGKKYLCGQCDIQWREK